MVFEHAASSFLTFARLQKIFSLQGNNLEAKWIHVMMTHSDKFNHNQIHFADHDSQMFRRAPPTAMLLKSETIQEKTLRAKKKEKEMELDIILLLTLCLSI